MKVPTELLRVYKALHTWTGLVAGLLLFVGFFAGALTMFKAPLDRWVSATPSAVASPWPGGVDDALLPELLARHPEAAAELTLRLHAAEHQPAPLNWVVGADGHGAELDGQHWWAGRDAAGQLQAGPQPASPLGELVDLLHRTGGIPGRVGDEYLGVYLMGVAGALYFLALVSGVVLLLPTLVKDFFAVRPGANRKRFWLDVHNVLGITSLPFHLVISLTVIVFAFHDQFYGALAQTVYGRHPMFEPPPAAAKPYEPAQLLPLSQLLARVQQEAPGFEPTELLYMRLASPRPAVRVALHHASAVVHGPRDAYLLLHPYSGAVLNDSMLPGRESPWSAPVNLFFALHFGSYGGEPVRWMYFAMGLAGAALFYTGNLLWLESRRPHPRPGQPLPAPRRAVRVMAAVTVGLCLGCMLAVGVALLAGRLGQARVADAQALYLGSFYATWLASLGWALWRGAARAAPVLLLACAVVALALPGSTALLGAAPWQAWQQGSLAPLAVDGVALLSAALCAWAAWRTRRRVMAAAPGSLWACAWPSAAAAVPGPASAHAASAHHG